MNGLYKHVESMEILNKHYTAQNFHPLISKEEKILDGYFNNIGLIDRTHTIMSEGKEVITEIPLNLTDLTLDDIIELAVDNVINTARGRTIYLMWSGGIDSTLVFYALLKRGISFKVIMNEASIREYPNLGNKIITNKIPGVTEFKMLSKEDFINKALNTQTSIVVTGELGDQMVGSDVNFQYKDHERQEPAKNHIPTDVYDLAMKSINKLPCMDNEDNLTLSEFLWAFNFIFKFQTVQLRKLFRAGISPIAPIANCIHFFNIDEFQQWAMSNFRENAKLTKDAEYKSLYKQYIYSQNGDIIYLKNKKKEGSKYADYLR